MNAVSKSKRPARIIGGSSSLRGLRLKLASFERENRLLQAELASRNGESHFRQVIDASPVPLSVDDMKGTIEYLNRKFEEKFGYSHKEIPTSAAWFGRAYPNPIYRRHVADQWKLSLEKRIACRQGGEAAGSGSHLQRRVSPPS